MSPKRNGRQVELDTYLSSAFSATNEDQCLLDSSSTQTDTPQLKKSRHVQNSFETPNSSLAEGLGGEDLSDNDEIWGVDPYGFIKGLQPPSVMSWSTEAVLGTHVRKDIRETQAEVILKRFDFDPTYGPHRGMTRLTRFDRATRLGLNPPSVVKMILQTLPEAFQTSAFDQRLGTSS